MKPYHEILYEQLARDYCCTPSDVRDDRNHFTEYQPLEGRRKWREQDGCYLKIAVINGKLLFSGNRDIMEWCREQYWNTGSEWFFEAKNMRRINDRIARDGYRIEAVHPFFIPDRGRGSRYDTSDYGIHWYEKEAIEQFHGDSRYENAYSFCEDAPDVIGIAAMRNGKILGMAGASSDSDTMWQIGIDVDQGARRCGIGQLLVALLKDEILRLGKLPFYGTAMSHIGSQNVALRAGFIPAWVELGTSGIEETPKVGNEQKS